MKQRMTEYALAAMVCIVGWSLVAWWVAEALK